MENCNNDLVCCFSGRKTGVFSDWDDCHAQVDGFKGACFKKYRTRAQALAAFKHDDQSDYKFIEKKKMLSWKDATNQELSSSCICGCRQPNMSTLHAHSVSQLGLAGRYEPGSAGKRTKHARCRRIAPA
ncbi:hypothetical protein EJB05_25906, partial [Eragrostis curvula]